MHAQYEDWFTESNDIPMNGDIVWNMVDHANH